MGIIWPDRPGRVADGQQATADGSEVQGLLRKGESAQAGADRPGSVVGDLSPVAGCSGDIHPLHYRIFSDSQKKCLVLLLK